MLKLSFIEITNKFIKKHGEDWCNNERIAESVVDTFIDYIMSLDEYQFDYEKVDNLKL